ncbi:MAG: hypothetical protein FWB76_05355 [Oscillospiraceae bacterium]|nr:hypothetical protein [Oscillospiraceae bacterium]
MAWVILGSFLSAIAAFLGGVTWAFNEIGGYGAVAAIAIFVLPLSGFFVLLGGGNLLASIVRFFFG